MNSIKIGVEGFVMGLATGHLCVATCGPIYAPFLMQKGATTKTKALLALMEISGGRFFAYALFGVVAGFLGKELHSSVKEWFTIISYILLSIVLVFSALTTRKHHKGCALTKMDSLSRNGFLLGIVTGVNFCPSFLMALTNAVDLSGPLAGFILFIAFFMGTNVFLIPFSAFGILGSRKKFQQIAFFSSLAVAFWFSLQAGLGLKQKIMPPSQNIVSLLDRTPTYILTKSAENFSLLADSLRMYNKEVTIVSEVPQSDSLFYLFIDNEYSQKEPRSYMERNRFVLQLPSSSNSLYDAEWIGSITHFLGEYPFLFTLEKGAFFSMKPKEK